MFKKIRQTKLYKEVAKQIEKEILSGGFKTGDKLPSEAELEEILGISRGTIRQSFRILEQKGVLEIKTGAHGGAFVREVTSDEISKSITSLIRFNYVTSDHIAEFRSGIEADLIAKLVAEKANPEDIRQLKAMHYHLTELAGQEKTDWNAFDTQEKKMHILLGKMTKNPLYEALSDTIMNSVQHMPGVIDRTQAIMDEVVNDWLNIVECLEKNDVVGTTKSIRAHVLKWIKIYEQRRLQKE